MSPEVIAQLDAIKVNMNEAGMNTINIVLAFMMFGVAYIIAALMTTGALVFYFRAILKNCSAYMLGGFVALVYMLNYMLLQMETYALLAGSLVLFLLLCVVMYLTADMSKNKELPKAE